MPKTLQSALKIIERRDAVIIQLREKIKQIKEELESKSKNIEKVNGVIINRNGKIAGLEDQVKTLKNQFNNFRDSIAAKIFSISDISEIMKTLERLLSVEDQLTRELKKQKKEAEKKQQALESENEQLRGDVKRLKKEIEDIKNKHKLEIELLEKKVDKVLANITSLEERKAENKVSKRFNQIEKVLGLVKKGGFKKNLINKIKQWKEIYGKKTKTISQMENKQRGLKKVE